jgi:hypothetical protein
VAFRLKRYIYTTPPTPTTIQLNEKNEILTRQVEELTAALETARKGAPPVSIITNLGAEEPSSPTLSPSSFAASLKRELEETRERLESERSVLAQERREAQKLRQELTVRRDREKWQGGSGILVQLAKISRIWQRSPIVPRHLPVNV